MKTNNLIQHLLVQLLNPGMYNEKILAATLAEITPANIQELLTQRFNFQNLKPAVLPIQSDWSDKEFSSYFTDFSHTNSLELSNGTVYAINLHNLADIVRQSKNKVAQTVSKEILSFLDKTLKTLPEAEQVQLNSVVIRNKRCDIEVSIQPVDFYKKKFTPDYFTDYEQFAINLLTNQKLLAIDDIAKDKTFKKTFLSLVKNNPEKLDSLVRLINIVSKNQAVLLMGYKDLAPSLALNKTIQQSFLHLLTNEEPYTTIRTLEKVVPQFFHNVGDKFAASERKDFLNSLMAIPKEKFLFYSRNWLEKKNVIHLPINEVQDLLSDYLKGYKKKPMPGSEQKDSCTLTYLFLNTLQAATDKISEKEMVSYLQTIGDFLVNPNTQEWQKNYRALQSSSAPLWPSSQNILAMCLSPALSLETLQKEGAIFLQIALATQDAKLRKDLINGLLDKGYYFTPQVKIKEKEYKIGAFKLSKDNVIRNEKNMLNFTISSAAQAPQGKFKI